MPSHHRTPDDLEPITAEMLIEARADSGRKWATRARCVGVDPELFFRRGDQPATEGRQICARCPVRGECLAYSVIADEPFGIWGGLDRDERRTLRRRLQRRGELPPSTAGSAA